MKFEQTIIPDAYRISIDRIEDDRGFFARTFCTEEFAQHGLATDLLQSNTCYTKKKGTLRGMHFQKAPFEEGKVIRCTMGKVYDVILDIRLDSPTFKQWVAFELSQENRDAVYVPKGCAHGYITLQDNCEVCYLMSQRYSKESASGIRYDDPAFTIQWPITPEVLSDADQSWLSFQDA